MNNLTVINQNGKFVVDSREVADMIDKQHKDLLESIRGYEQFLLSGDFRSVDFFIPHTYQDSTGRTLPCYLLTRKGCDMVANKMTGEKGVLFTAAYVTKFEEMEKSLVPSMQQLSPQLQLLISMELRQNQLEERIDKQEQIITAVKEAFLQRDEPWRESINKMLNRLARDKNEYQSLRADTYQQLERRAGCDLNARLRNLKERAARHGMGKTKIDTLNRLDVIENDKKLKEIYTTVVKEMSLARV